jgi:hypothetical protein
MVRVLLPFAAMIAACTPSSEDAAMHSRSPAPSTPAANSVAGTEASRAAPGPVPGQVPAAAKSAARKGLDTPAEAEGRRTLSTAFVRVGPDGHLTVVLRNGPELLLRNVVMGAKDYCGTQAGGERFCGGYAEVAAARPGGAPVGEQPDLAVSNPLGAANPPADPK